MVDRKGRRPESLLELEFGKDTFRDFVENLPALVPQIKSVEVFEDKGFPQGRLGYEVRVEDPPFGYSFLFGYLPYEALRQDPQFLEKHPWLAQTKDDYFFITQPLRRGIKEETHSRQIKQLSRWWEEKVEQLVEKDEDHPAQMFEIKLEKGNGILLLEFSDITGYTSEGMIDFLKGLIGIVPEVARKVAEIFGSGERKDSS